MTKTQWTKTVICPKIIVYAKIVRKTEITDRLKVYLPENFDCTSHRFLSNMT